MPTSLILPDVAQATHSEMEAMLPSFDGAWSSQTKALLARFNTGLLELDGNWASVDARWRCPVCSRGKPEIARLTGAGVLLCRLDRHHDHLGDEGNRILWRAQPRHADRKSREACSSAIQACSALAERFHPTLVCSDCNTADSAAKALLNGVPRAFSFSPSEIARFIRPRPNQVHELDAAAVHAIWSEAAEDAADRLAFMLILAERIRQGRHAREGSPYRPHPMATLFGDLIEAAGHPRSSGEFLISEIANQSVRRDGYGSSVTPKPRTRIEVPSEKDLDAFTSAGSPGPFWHEPPDDWRCACCDRNRLEMLRRSPKSRLWTAGAHRRRVFVTETRPEALRWRNAEHGGLPMFRDHQTVWICKDCRQIITDIKLKGPDLTDECLTVADVQAVLTRVEPHDRPDYDRVEAALRAGDAEFGWLIAEYDEHRNRCLGLFYDKRDLLKNACASDVRTRLLADVKDGHIALAERPALLDWLLGEGEIFAKANETLKLRAQSGSGRPRSP